ncbi:MAG: hypothetical protein KKB13_00145 [Chloroflexi bacterium]|nr:hypothetical protein [Chloroflexota bacterium]
MIHKAVEFVRGRLVLLRGCGARVIPQKVAEQGPGAHRILMRNLVWLVMGIYQSKSVHLSVIAIAYSDDLFEGLQVRLMGTAGMGTPQHTQPANSREQQARRLDYLALGIPTAGLDRVEPGVLDRDSVQHGAGVAAQFDRNPRGAPPSHIR